MGFRRRPLLGSGQNAEKVILPIKQFEINMRLL